MKRSIRLLLILAFAAVNLALAGTPADAFRWRAAECLSEDGEEQQVCCVRCIFFCDDCSILED